MPAADFKKLVALLSSLKDRPDERLVQYWARRLAQAAAQKSVPNRCSLATIAPEDFDRARLATQVKAVETAIDDLILTVDALSPQAWEAIDQAALAGAVIADDGEHFAADVLREISNRRSDLSFALAVASELAPPLGSGRGIDCLDEFAEIAARAYQELSGRAPTRVVAVTGDNEGAEQGPFNAFIAELIAITGFPAKASTVTKRATAKRAKHRV